ncbi:mitochondrial import inner membrane translocase subunit Tim13-like [Toxorhynchites rutilus septentrionalis]|uniref:mitochondrial import inner membrane translocase subunit Tim13-like n=1 Tax=Toxorhynchites rutilus septentrionalis TaxID=329112 RepID=UPI00247AF1FD|nr:mitochondrial import inner membrane translocase subunit Tim13-like [Toxorhynchites rutilus septentrionalis]
MVRYPRLHNVFEAFTRDSDQYFHTVVPIRNTTYHKCSFVSNCILLCDKFPTSAMDVALDNLSSSQKDELMSQVKQQIAIANAQELLSKMTEKCFKKCISKPGLELDNSERKCIAMCMDRYMDSWNLVSRTYTHRIQKEQFKG